MFGWVVDYRLEPSRHVASVVTHLGYGARHPVDRELGPHSVRFLHEEQAL